MKIALFLSFYKSTGKWTPLNLPAWGSSPGILKKKPYKRSMEVVKNDHYMWVNWLFLAIFEVLAPGPPYKSLI